MMQREDFAAVGRALYGGSWQAEMARGLGPLHPAGARETIDGRLVRRWISGERDIPTWVEPACRQLLVERGRLISELIDHYQGS